MLPGGVSDVNTRPVIQRLGAKSLGSMILDEKPGWGSMLRGGHGGENSFGLDLEVRGSTELGVGPVTVGNGGVRGSCVSDPSS